MMAIFVLLLALYRCSFLIGHCLPRNNTLKDDQCSGREDHCGGSKDSDAVKESRSEIWIDLVVIISYQKESGTWGSVYHFLDQNRMVDLDPFLDLFRPVKPTRILVSLTLPLLPPSVVCRSEPHFHC